MFHLNNVEICCFDWKLWLSTENVLMAGLQWLTKVGILYGKQMIPSQSSFPLRQTFSFLTEGTRTVLMEGIWPDFTNSPVVWSTTNWSVCVNLLCSKHVPAQPASQHCLCWKTPAESWVVGGSSSLGKYKMCFKDCCFTCSLCSLHTEGASHQWWQALEGQPWGQIWHHPSLP